MTRQLPARMMTLAAVAKALAVIAMIFLAAVGMEPELKAKQPPASPAQKTQKTTASTAKTQTPTKVKGPSSAPAELIRLLERKRAELERERQRLAQERRQLEKLKKEIAQRIAELKKVQQVLKKLVAEEQTQRRKRILQLVKVMSNMRPEAAAAVVEKLDDQMAVEIFSRMNSRIAGKVMAALPPERAARISVLLTRKKEAQAAAKVAAEAAPK